jgi:hypothetical protein
MARFDGVIEPDTDAIIGHVQSDKVTLRPARAWDSALRSPATNAEAWLGGNRSAGRHLRNDAMKDFRPATFIAVGIR